MPLSPQLMRMMLFICILGMALFAALYLRSRRLSVPAFLGWGIIILLIPLIGPFLVILIGPGERRAA